MEGRTKARFLMSEFNAPLQPDVPFSETVAQREETLRKLFGRAGRGIYIEPPLFVDYGCNISVGDGFYANFK
jgi:hypothetical protein